MKMVDTVSMTSSDMPMLSWFSDAMTRVELSHVLILATALFVVGLAGALSRKRWFQRVLSIQVMMYAVIVMFVASGRYWQTPDGQVVVFFVIIFAVIQMMMALMLAYVTYLFGSLHDAIETSKQSKSSSLNEVTDLLVDGDAHQAASSDSGTSSRDFPALTSEGEAV